MVLGTFWTISPLGAFHPNFIPIRVFCPHFLPTLISLESLLISIRVSPSLWFLSSLYLSVILNLFYLQAFILRLSVSEIVISLSKEAFFVYFSGYLGESRIRMRSDKIWPRVKSGQGWYRAKGEIRINCETRDRPLRKLKNICNYKWISVWIKFGWGKNPRKGKMKVFFSLLDIFMLVSHFNCI